MAYYLTELMDAIRDRLQADTGSGGLFASGAELVSSVWPVRAPEESDGYWHAAGKDAEDPHIVFNVRATGAPDGFRTKSRAVEISLAIYVKPSHDPASDPLEDLGAIAARVEGDWEAQSVGTAPTYGLVRWTPTITNHGANALEFPQAGEVIEPFDADAWLGMGMTLVTGIHRQGA